MSSRLPSSSCWDCGVRLLSTYPSSSVLSLHRIIPWYTMSYHIIPFCISSGRITRPSSYHLTAYVTEPHEPDRSIPCQMTSYYVSYKTPAMPHFPIQINPICNGVCQYVCVGACRTTYMHRYVPAQIHTYLHKTHT